jgi:hypothetical protein
MRADQVFPTPPEPQKPKIGERFFEWVKQNHKERAAEFPGQMEAMAREAVKDVRGTIHQAFFGQMEHAPEQGTPLNPTPQIVTEQLGGYQDLLDSQQQQRGGRDR